MAGRWRKSRERRRLSISTRRRRRLSPCTLGDGGLTPRVMEEEEVAFVEEEVGCVGGTRVLWRKGTLH
jgi:hypothetical protein